MGKKATKNSRKSTYLRVKVTEFADDAAMVVVAKEEPLRDEDKFALTRVVSCLKS